MLFRSHPATLTNINEDFNKNTAGKSGWKINDFSKHQGSPVEAGIKYVITKWFRERPWSPTSVTTY